MSLLKIHQLIAEAWPVHGIEEDEACAALILNVLKEVREETDQLREERRTGACAYDGEGRTICPAVAKTEQMKNTETSSKPYRYEEAKRMLRAIIGDFLILSGDEVGPSNTSWQSVAATAAINLHVLGLRMEAARGGYVADSPVVFPSPADLDDENPNQGDQDAQDKNP